MVSIGVLDPHVNFELKISDKNKILKYPKQSGPNYMTKGFI